MKFTEKSWDSLFTRDQRLRLETPGWRVQNFQSKHYSEDKREQQTDKNQKGLLVIRDREDPFTEDLIVDEARVSDPNLPLLTEVTSLVWVVQSGGSHALVEKLWSQFLLTAGNNILENTWNRDGVFVSSVEFPE